MTDARLRRQRAIADMIRSGPVASQEEVSARLAELGFAVTQATVSRDLEQIGAIKAKRGGVLAYALPDQLASSDWAATRLRRILDEWIQSAELAGNLVVLRTPPGSAHLVGSALDGAQLPEIAGTLAGDDTLFIAVREGHSPAQVMQRIRRNDQDQQ